MPRRTFIAASAVAPAMAAAGGMVRTGILGVQHGHLKGKPRAMLDSSKYEVFALCEPDRTMREDFIKSWSGDRSLNWVSMDALLADPATDLIVFEGEVRDAVSWGTEIIEAGKLAQTRKSALRDRGRAPVDLVLPLGEHLVLHAAEARVPTRRRRPSPQTRKPTVISSGNTASRMSCPSKCDSQ